jgi:molybdate transport system substrate-binding protein
VRNALAFCLAIFLIPQGLPQPAPITVSAAVSLTDALSAVATEYANAGRGGVRFNFGASNVLAQAGLIQDGSRVPLLGNQLAVVVPSDRPRTFTRMAQITDPAFRRIALGDPAAVPAGVYARQYLEKEGLWAAVEARIVPTGSVRGALAAVESGSADAAIVYRTDARGALRATVAWVVPADRGPRIVYPGAIVRGSKNAAGAARFLDFLRGSAAERTFSRYGFTAIKQ